MSCFLLTKARSSKTLSKEREFSLNLSLTNKKWNCLIFDTNLAPKNHQNPPKIDAKMPSHILGVSWGHLERLGSLLGASWAVLEPSWGLLAAKTHQKRGQSVFWRPLGAVLGSFLGGFWMVFGMNFQYFSYLILRYLNMS